MLRPARRLRRLVPALLLAVMASCTPYSTFPPVETGEAILPWMYPVPQVMSKSLRATYEKTVGPLELPDGTPTLVYAIPAGASQGVWDQVGSGTDIEGARPMVEEDMFDGVGIWAVEQVRIRNQRAEVDVIFPVPDGYERATVILEANPLEPYRVKFFQRWRVPVEPPVYTGPDQADEEVEEVSETQEVVENGDGETSVVEEAEAVETDG